MARDKTAPTAPASFRLTESERERIDALAREIGTGKTDVIRFGLIALRTLVNEGYEFRNLGERPTIFKRSPQGRTIKFFDVSADGALIDHGRMAQWTGAPEDE